MAITVDHGQSGLTIDFDPNRAETPAAAADQLANGLAETIAGTEAADPRAPEPVTLWIHDVDESFDQVASNVGFVAYRDLWQLRCPLPRARSTLMTRGYEPGDADELIRVNNRAFSWHPEQSGLDRDRLAATMAEAWFVAEGVRLYERDGRLAGFCWTKIHHDLEPAIGEIFVIGVDPDFHGQGLGIPMTLAGLDWLSDRGLTTAMLYVESDNHAATATYAKIGFDLHRIDRAYRLER